MMLDPSIPWLASGYRKFLSPDSSSSSSTSLVHSPLTDGPPLAGSGRASQQQQRVRSAIVSSRQLSQPTPPATPDLTPIEEVPRPYTALSSDYARDYSRLQPTLPQRPKSALPWNHHQGGTMGQDRITQHRLPWRVKSARRIRHRPSALQNKSITQVERLHHSRLMVSSIPVSQTTNHRPCAYCPVECRPRSCSSHRPTSSTGLSPAEVPCHFDRTKLWARGMARPRTAPTSRREFLHLPRHNYIRRGTVPHYTHFIKGLSLYPRDGSPLPVSLNPGPTILVQDDGDRSLSSREFGVTDTAGFSASVMNDSDWEDIDDEYDSFNGDILHSEVLNVSVLGNDGRGDQSSDAAPGSPELLPFDATDEYLTMPAPSTERDVDMKFPPTTPTASPITEEGDVAGPTTDIDLNNEQPERASESVDEKNTEEDNLQPENQPEKVLSVDEDKEPADGTTDMTAVGTSEGNPGSPIDTGALGRQIEDVLVVSEDKGDNKETEVELRPMITMLPAPAEKLCSGQSSRRKPALSDTMTGSRMTKSQKSVRIQEPGESRTVVPGEGQSVKGIDRTKPEGQRANGDHSRPPSKDNPDMVPPKLDVPQEGKGVENLTVEKIHQVPDLVLPEGEDGTVNDGEESLSQPQSSRSEAVSGAETLPAAPKLGPRPPKVKVDFVTMDADTMKEILDMEMKLRRKEAADKSSGTEDIEDDGNGISKKIFVPSSWNCCRVALSRQAGRFEIPMDIRDLIGLAPADYLIRHCRVSSQRRALYRRTFSKNDRDNDGKLKRKEIERAVTEALVDTIEAEQVSEVLRSIGADHEDLMMKFELFAPFCALLERLYYSQFVTEDSADRDATLKDPVEEADFFALEWKLEGYNINNNLRRLLHSL